MIDDVCDFLVENKYAQSLEDIFFLVRGLQVCADNHLRVPLVLTVVSAGASATPAQVRITNVFDEFATGARVVLARAQTDSDSDEQSVATVAENVELSPASTAKNNVLYNLEKAKAGAWTPNFYLLKFTVSPTSDSERFGQERITKRIKVTANYAPSKLELYTAESAKGPAEGKTESYVTHLIPHLSFTSFSLLNSLLCAFTLCGLAFWARAVCRTRPSVAL